MTKCLAWAPLVVALLGACSRQPTGDGAKHEAPGEDACSLHATHLEGSVPLPRFQPPAGCTPSGQAPLFPQPVTSEAELGQYFRCAGGTSGVDFGNLQLWVADGSLSPAETGIEALDDGRTITLVDHFRSPCPNDPHPMPTSDVFAFVSTRGATRTFARMHCTVQSKCE